MNKSTQSKQCTNIFKTGKEPSVEAFTKAMIKTINILENTGRQLEKQN